MMARVRGSWMVNLVPAPGRLSASTRPFSFSIDFSTTSRPTPRPERSVTVRAVEKPSEKMSWTASLSLKTSSGPHQPLLDGPAAHLVDVDPAPVVHDGEDHLVRFLGRGQEQGAGRRLAAGHPHVGGLDAVVDTVADHVDEGLAELVDDGLVDPGLLALEDQLDLLALLARQVAHEAGKALEDVPDGKHPDVHDRLLELAAHPGDLVHGLEQLAARLVQHESRGQVLGDLLQLGAVDDQLADQVQQVVELGEVHPHHARADRGVGLRPPLRAAGHGQGQGLRSGRGRLARARSRPAPSARRRAGA